MLFRSLAVVMLVACHCASTPPVRVLAPPSYGVYRRSLLLLTWSRLGVYSQIYDRALSDTISASRAATFSIMVKRTATELQTATSADSNPRKQPRASEPRETPTQEDEIGNFEDDWEDEYESDEEVVDEEAEEDRDGMCLVMADKYVDLIFLLLKRWISTRSCLPSRRPMKQSLLRALSSPVSISSGLTRYWNLTTPCILCGTP